MRAALNVAELSAMPFRRSSRPTISTRKDCRDGMSSAFTSPITPARVATCQYRTEPVHVRAARAKAGSIRAIWVARMSRRFGVRSTTTPATAEKRSTGANWSALTSPRRKGELVSSSTSQDRPTDCIQLPTEEMD